MRRRRRLGAIGASLFMLSAAAAAVGSGGVAGAQGPSSLAVINVPTGDPVTAGFYRLPDVTVSAGDSTNGFTLTMVHAPSGNTFSMAIAPKTGSPFTAIPPAAVQTETGTGKTATAGRAQLDVTRTGNTACASSEGSFTLRDIAFGGGGELTRLAMEFSQRCLDAPSPAPITGTVYFNEPDGPLALPPVTPSEFYPIAPVRVLDTRGSSPLTAGGTVNAQVTGGATGVDAGATAVVVNITAVGPSEATFLTAFPAGEARPNVSNVNPKATDTVPNLATVKVGSGGQITLYNELGTTNAIVDVMGFYKADDAGADGFRFSGMTPVRKLDTRDTGTPFGAGETRSVDIDATAAAAVLNVTVTQPTAGGYLTVFPDALGSAPIVSNLNFAAGQTIPNLVVVKLDAGKAKIFNPAGQTHVIVDLVGTYKAAASNADKIGQFVSISPTRVLDSRTPLAPLTGKNTLGPAQSDEGAGYLGLLGKFPFEYKALVANVTATNTTADGYLTVYPTGTNPPFTSNLNWAAGETRANLVATGTDSFGFASTFNAAGSTDYIVDVAGLFIR
jgi:hypothetical protein